MCNSSNPSRLTKRERQKRQQNNDHPWFSWIALNVHTHAKMCRETQIKNTQFSLSLSLSLSLSKIYQNSYGSWINIALWFYFSFSLLLSLSLSSANIYIHKSLNCNSKSRLIAAEVTELLMGIFRGNEKRKKEKRRATTTKKIEIYYALCSLYCKYVCKILLPNPNTECAYTQYIHNS